MRSKANIYKLSLFNDRVVIFNLFIISICFVGNLCSKEIL